MTAWREVSPESILKVVEACDGWIIFNPESLADRMGVPKSLLPVQTYKSDGTLKGSITRSDGVPVNSMEGVYGLSLLYAIGSGLGLDTSNNYTGRGYQADHLKRLILQYLDTTHT